MWWCDVIQYKVDLNLFLRTFKFINEGHIIFYYFFLSIYSYVTRPEKQVPVLTNVTAVPSPASLLPEKPNKHISPCGKLHHINHYCTCLSRCYGYNDNERGSVKQHFLTYRSRKFIGAVVF